jgi:hypothetical protein
VVDIRARVQNGPEGVGDFSGTIAADNGDFENLKTILGLDANSCLIGAAVWTHHHSIGIQGRFSADASSTALTVWSVDSSEWRMESGGNLPEWLATSPRPLAVTEYTADTVDITYSAPQLDAVSLLLRSAKRLSFTLWDPEVLRLGLRDEDFSVTTHILLTPNGNTWDAQPQAV